jgi:hypothetical protein
MRTGTGTLSKYDIDILLYKGKECYIFRFSFSIRPLHSYEPFLIFSLRFLKMESFKGKYERVSAEKYDEFLKVKYLTIISF